MMHNAVTSFSSRLLKKGCPPRALLGGVPGDSSSAPPTPAALSPRGLSVAKALAPPLVTSLGRSAGQGMAVSLHRRWPLQAFPCNCGKADHIGVVFGGMSPLKHPQDCVLQRGGAHAPMQCWTVGANICENKENTQRATRTSCAPRIGGDELALALHELLSGLLQLRLHHQLRALHLPPAMMAAIAMVWKHYQSDPAAEVVSSSASTMSFALSTCRLRRQRPL